MPRTLDQIVIESFGGLMLSNIRLIAENEALKAQLEQQATGKKDAPEKPTP